MDKKDQNDSTIKIVFTIISEANKEIIGLAGNIAKVMGKLIVDIASGIKSAGSEIINATGKINGTISTNAVKSLTQTTADTNKVTKEAVAKQSKLWSDSIKSIGSAAKNVAGTIKKVSSTIFSMAKSGVDQVIKIGNSFDSFSNKMSTIDAGVDALGQSMIAGLEAPLNDMADFGITAVNQLQESFNAGGMEAMLETGSNLLLQMLEGITAALPSIIDYASEILTVICNSINELAPEAAASGFGILSQLLVGIMENLPIIAETALNVLLALINGISEQLPALMPVAASMVLTLIQGLIENLPALLTTGMNLLDGLVTGIFGALPGFIEKVPEIINQFLGTLGAMGPDLINGGMTILTKIIEGIGAMIGSLLTIGIQLVAQFINLIQTTDWNNVGMKILNGVIDGIRSLLGTLGTVGAELAAKVWDAIQNTNWLKLGGDIINGLVNGVIGGISGLVNAAKKACSKMFDAVVDFFSIFSPSHKMRDEIGKFLPSGIAVGFEEAMPLATKNMVNATNSGFKRLKDSATSMNTNFINSLSFAGAGSINNFNSEVIDYDRLANSMTKVKMGVYMDKTEVGRIITPTVDEEIGKEMSRKRRYGA